MAKAKKPEPSNGGATKKQATETKKAASESKAQSAAPKATKSAASTTKAAASTEKSPVAEGPARKKAAAKAAPAATPPAGSVPLIDTSLAAEAAAKFVANRALLGNVAARGATRQDEDADEAQGEKRESSTFKQLKAGLSRPASQELGGILGGTTQGKKGNTRFGGGGQHVGRNQTFGADVNRSGVPRRTGG